MSRSRDKGTAAETAVVQCLQRYGWDAERRALAGVNDRGDIAGVPACIEVKNCQRVELGEWVDEANEEATNAAEAIGVVWHKRRGFTDPAKWYVTMDGLTFMSLLRGQDG